MDRRNSDESLQLTIVGERNVGKTSLLRSYRERQFNASDLIRDDWRVTLDYETTQTILVNDVAYPFKLKDTIFGSSVFTENIFPLQCVGTSALLVCYAVDDRTSFIKLENVIFVSFRILNSNVPIVIVATKIDRRDIAEPQSCVSTDEGRAMSRRVKAAAFIECSALSGENVRQVFYQAAKAAVNQISSKEKKKCILM